MALTVTDGATNNNKKKKMISIYETIEKETKFYYFSLTDQFYIEKISKALFLFLL